MIRGVRLRSAALVTLGLLAAACGSSSAPPGGASSSTSTTGPTASHASTASPAGSAPALRSATSAYGTILVNGAGRTLYGLSADSATKSTCTSSACVAVWPPFLVSAVPRFGSGVSQSLVGQLARPDGSHQLTYGGHPLYTFTRDSASGQVHGEGVSSFGGTWYVISASTGKFVTAKTGSSSSSSSGGGGGGYGAGY